jgi:hypothetical protein
MLHHRRQAIADERVPKSIGRAKNAPISKDLSAQIVALKLQGFCSAEIVDQLNVKESWIQLAWARYRSEHPKTPDRPRYNPRKTLVTRSS